MILVSDKSYLLRRQVQGFRSRFGSRAVLVHAVIIAIFGIWWPHIRGVEFFDPVFLTAYACLGVLFAGPAAAQAFSDRPMSMPDAITRVALAAAYGEGITLLILAAGITTAMRGVPIGPDWIGLAWAVVLGLLGTFAMAAVAGWIALRFSPAAARHALRIIFLGLLLLFFFRSRWLPDVVGRGISITIGVAILAMFAIQRALRRH